MELGMIGLKQRFSRRGCDGFAEKVLSALGYQFCGDDKKTAADKAGA
jgi:6-phosphogluconate dehydrogenase (decarboxylating)